jgi:hypothetical protein
MQQIFLVLLHNSDLQQTEERDLAIDHTTIYRWAMGDGLSHRQISE